MGGCKMLGAGYGRNEGPRCMELSFGPSEAGGRAVVIYRIARV